MRYFIQFTQDGESHHELIEHDSLTSLLRNLRRRKGIDRNTIQIHAVDPSQTFGYWEILEDPKEIHGDKIFCRCVCGTIRKVFLGQLKQGKSKSCGCKRQLLTIESKNLTLYEHNGKSHTLGKWASILGIRHQTLSSRLKMGWTIEKTLSTPVRRYTESEKTE